MQDTVTGDLIPLTPAQADAEFKRRANLDQQFGELRKDFDQRMREAQNLPPVKQRGPIFAVGEIIEIRGGSFRVIKIAKHKLVLRGVPKSP